MIRICHNFDVEMEQYGSCPGSDGEAPITCRDNCPYMEIINEDDALKQAADRVTKDKESATKFLKSAGIMDKDGNLAKIYR